jgi:hypothetical protein
MRSSVFIVIGDQQVCAENYLIIVRKSNIVVIGDQQVFCFGTNP